MIRGSLSIPEEEEARGSGGFDKWRLIAKRPPWFRQRKGGATSLVDCSNKVDLNMCWTGKNSMKETMK